MQGQNKPITRHCQDISERGEKMVQIVIDIALIVTSIAAIVIVLRGKRK